MLVDFKAEASFHSLMVCSVSLSIIETKMDGVLPRLVAIDLDDTLWSPEMWLCSGAPFTATAGRVYDRSGTEIQLIGDSKRILNELATDVSGPL